MYKHRKVILMIVVEIIFLVVLGSLLTGLQTEVSLMEQRENLTEKQQEISQTMEDSVAAEKDTIISYDEIFQGKAGSLAFMFQNGVMEGYTAANMQEAKDLLEVNNVLIINREGEILTQAEKTPADFKRERFNQLKDTFRTGESSEAFNVTYGEKTFRYYGYKIDEDVMVVIERSPEELNELLEKTSTWHSILSKITVGLDGFAFAVSARDYTFLYYPDETMVGKDALTNGVHAEYLEENKFNWMEINGQKLYCGVHKAGDTYIVCAVSSEEILASRNTTVAIVLFSFFAVLTLVITYAFFIVGEGKEHEKKKIGKWWYNKTIGKKISVVSIIGLACILLVSFYMQSIFALSRQSMSNNQKVAEVEEEMNYYEKEREDVREQYNKRYLNKAEIVTYIVEKKPELITRDTLAEISNILDIEAVNVFDRNGVLTKTNSSYTNFRLSDNPEDQSYLFWKLLEGADNYIQEARKDEVSGKFHQYIGVTLRDKEYFPIGFVQISLSPSKLETAIASMQIDKILSGIKMGNGGNVFGINKEENVFAYYVNPKLIGKNPLKVGMKESELVDGYSGYITIKGEKFWAASRETNKYFVFAATPKNSIGGKQLPLTLVSVFASFIALLIVMLMLTLSRKPDSEEEKVPEGYSNGSINLEMPDHTVKTTKSAASRWTLTTVQWADKTPEQKIFLVFKGLLGLLAVLICIGVLFREQIFDDSSVIKYVLSGKWAKGFNIFALTSSMLLVCVASVITMVLQYILTSLAKTFGAKGETICRLLSNFVKYFSILVVIYYCLALLGVDTSTLLASAGILSLVIGLGAQSLVSDILAGLFIIFEGEFQVGDIVTIGDWRGNVVEIGIRTTKILDPSGNIKIISNSDVTGVINMTREYSYSWCDVGIEYGESLERVESILQKEFPNIKEHLPNIIDGPFYKGVVSLGDNSVNIRVMVLCAEKDRAQMERDLNREMKLIFDKYDVNIPFPQIVINQPTKYQKATAQDIKDAEVFREQQRVLAGNLVEDDEDR